MKYTYKFNVMRFVFLMGLLGLFNLQNARSQGLLNNTTYIVNGANDLVAPVDTFANLTGPITGPSYGAMTYLNQYGMAATQTSVGQVTFLLSAGYNPVEPNVINIGNASATPNLGWPNMFWNQNSPIVMKPAAGQNFNITTSTTVGNFGSLLRMNNAWFFTIDGSNNGTTSRNLTFSMPSGSNGNNTTAKVIDLVPTVGQKVQFLTIKNCVVVGSSSLTTAVPLSVNTYAGIYLGGVGTTPQNAANGRNQNITVTNNLIVACQNGVYYRGLGNAVGNQDRNISINDNIIGDYVNPVFPANTAFIGGSANASGVYLSAGVNAVIDNNIIRNSVGNSQSMRGVSLNNDAGPLALDSNVQVTRNRIYNMNNTLSAGVYGIRINLGSHAQHLRLLVANNGISGLVATVAQGNVASVAYPIGILVEDASSLVGLEVFFNSVNLTGSTLPANAVSACFVTGAGVTGGVILMNNSFANSMGRLPANTTGYTNYNVITLSGSSSTPNNPFLYSSFNNYFTTTYDGGNAYMGRGNARDYTSLKGYRFFSRSDSTSFSTIPPFKNDTDLTVNSGVSHFTFNRGVNLFQFVNFYKSISDSIRFKVNVDVFNTSRNGMGRFTPIGFHKWAGDSTNNDIAIQGGKTYLINGGTTIRPTQGNLGNGAKFSNLTQAIDYLNHYGVSGSGAITLQLASGYAGEPGFLPAMIDYPGSSIGLPVSITVATAYNATITAPNVPAVNNMSIIRFMGASNVTVNGGSTKRLNIVMPDTNTNTLARLVGIVPVDTASASIRIMNCNLIGNSKPLNVGVATNPNTSMGIYVGNQTTAGGAPVIAQTTGINNISFIGNTISAVRSGIVFWALGASSTSLIKSNIIGGTIPPLSTASTERTTYVGGVAGQAGIWVRSLTDCTIDSNVIRNCVPGAALSNGFTGIFIDDQGGPIFNSVNVTRNFMYNLITQQGTYCAGIRVFFQNVDGSRGISLINNFMGSISGNGTSAIFNTQNPAGIIIDAPLSSGTPLVNVGLSIAHNTVNLTGNGLGASSGGTSAALFVSANVRGGIGLVNNILINRLNRTNGTTGKRYAVLVGPVSPFISANVLPFAANNNNYYAEGNGLPPGSPYTNFIGGSYNPTTLQISDKLSINDWRAFSSLTPAPLSDGSSFSWNNTFLTDTTPNIALLNGGPVPGGAAIVTLICNDIYGNPRFACSGGSTTVTRWVGAVESGTPYPALQGNVVYKINGQDVPPTPVNPSSNIQFKTVRAAVNYLNSQGVDDPSFGGTRTIRMEIDNGYVGETDTFTTPITVFDYPRMAPTRPVLLTVATGRTDTIRIVSTINPSNITNQSVIRFSGCRYFTIDGGSRNLTIMVPSAFNAATNKVIDVISGVNTVTSTSPSTTNNTVRNCNIIGNSTTSANLNFAGIYTGGLATPSNGLVGDNNNNVFYNNFIGGVQYGVYLRGATSRANMDNGVQVVGNNIGGNIAPGGTAPTNYFGGVSNAAGIYALGQANLTINTNTIKNNITGFLAPRGIELATIPAVYVGLDSVVKITANTIDNIVSNVAGGAYGVYVNFGGDATNVNRAIVIANNMISGISSLGTTATGTGFAQNPYGVFLDATTNIGTGLQTSVDVSLYFNSINLGQATTLTASNSLSAAFGLVSQIRGGINSKDNIFQTRLGSTSTSNAYGVAVGGTVNPFNISNYNDYYAAITSSGTAASMASNVSTAPVFYQLWNDIMSFTKQDTLSITSQAAFTSDNNLAIPSSTSSNLYRAGVSIPGYPADIFGTGRFLLPSIGAHEFSGAYNDNIAPRLFNVTDPTLCTSGPINVNFNIYDQQLSADTFYYKINGGAVQSLQASFSNGSFRRYTIPAQASGTLIEYRVSAIDLKLPPNNGIYPVGKPWDTISTGITNFPYTNGWEGANNPAWTVQTLSGNGTWEVNAQGSQANPPLGAHGGLKNAMFRSSSFTAGAAARLVSPCLDLTNMVSPTLRFWVSQNSDLTNKRDSIAVTLSAGGGFWTNPLRIVQRVNPSFALPGWMMVEVCLAQFATSGMRVGIEGYSAGAGQNILIDDITIFDDVQNQAITPKIFSQCYSDSIRININNSDMRFEYRVIDRATNQYLAVKQGENANIYIGIATPQLDTLRYIVQAANTNSVAINSGFGGGFITCSNIMPDSITTYINRFYNGPFVTAGLPFNGSYNNGDVNTPDGARVGDTITYKFVPPTFYQNSNYGSLWSIPSITAYTVSSNSPFTNFTFVAPSGNTAGYVRIIAPANMVDTSIAFVFRMRINASSCDTVFQRVLHIAIPPTANFVFTPATNLCANNNIQFDASPSVKPSNNFPFYYGWFFGDNTQEFSSNPTKQYAAAGTYQVRLILTDRYGLTSEKLQTITVLPSPVTEFTTNVPCATDSTVFTPTAQPAGTSFLWTLPNNTTQTREVAKFNFSKYDTAYNVKVRITNAQGCYGEKTQNIYVFAKPTAAFSTSPHCLNTFVPITNTSSIPVGTLGITWFWGNGSNSLGMQPTYKYPAAGTYSATLKVSSEFGCQDSIVKTVTVYDRPFVDFTATNTCSGENDQTVFNNGTTFAGGAQNVDYTWDFGDTKPLSSVVNPTHAYSIIGNQYVRLLAVDKLNGCRDSIAKFIQIYRKPVAIFLSSPISGACVNNEVVFINNSYTIDQGNFTCFWDWNDGKSDQACTINHTYTATGTVSPKLIITSIDGGCKDTATRTLVITDAPTLTIDTQYVDIPTYPYCKNKLKLSASIPNATIYAWSMGDKLNTKKSTQVVEMVYPDKDTVTVTLSVTDSNGCVVVKSMDIIIPCAVGMQELAAQKFNLTAYPNPFANTANVGYELDKTSDIRITVMDMLGRVIKTNELGKMQAGKHQFTLDEANFGAAGTYMIKVEVNGEAIYKQLIKQ